MWLEAITHDVLPVAMFTFDFKFWKTGKIFPVLFLGLLLLPPPLPNSNIFNISEIPHRHSGGKWETVELWCCCGTVWINLQVPMDFQQFTYFQGIKNLVSQQYLGVRKLFSLLKTLLPHWRNVAMEIVKDMDKTTCGRLLAIGATIKRNGSLSKTAKQSCFKYCHFLDQ